MNKPATHSPEQVLHHVYDEAAVGLCYLDTDLRYLHINKWLAQLNGLPVEKHLGRTIHEVLPNVAAGVAAELRQVWRRANPSRREWSRPRPRRDRACCGRSCTTISLLSLTMGESSA